MSYVLLADHLTFSIQIKSHHENLKLHIMACLVCITGQQYYVVANLFATVLENLVASILEAQHWSCGLEL
jgi:hypothetical protein